MVRSGSARRHATRARASRRRGPVGAAPDAVLVGHIRRGLEPSPFHGEGDRKAWATLRVEGIRTSQERGRRFMREHDLQAPPRAGHAHGPKAHDGTITTAAPDVMWGTDLTTTVTVGEGAACVFVAVDHCTTECIGLHAVTCFEALEPIRQGIRQRFGAIGEGVGVERCENSSRTPRLTVLALAGSSDIGGCGRRRSHLPGKSREIQVQNSVSLPFRRLKRRYSRGVGRRMARRSRVAAD